jgi:hypothetical protein
LTISARSEAEKETESDVRCSHSIAKKEMGFVLVLVLVLVL